MVNCPDCKNKFEHVYNPATAEIVEKNDWEWDTSTKAKQSKEKTQSDKYEVLMFNLGGKDYDDEFY